MASPTQSNSRNLKINFFMRRMAFQRPTACHLVHPPDVSRAFLRCDHQSRRFGRRRTLLSPKRSHSRSLDTTPRMSHFALQRPTACHVVHPPKVSRAELSRESHEPRCPLTRVRLFGSSALGWRPGSDGSLSSKGALGKRTCTVSAYSARGWRDETARWRDGGGLVDVPRRELVAFVAGEARDLASVAEEVETAHEERVRQQPTAAGAAKRARGAAK